MLIEAHNTLAGYKAAYVDTILKKITPHVPVSAPAVKPSHQMQQALVSLNLSAAKLLSRLLPTQVPAEEDEEEGWRARLLDYYTGIMEAGQVLPSRSVAWIRKALHGLEKPHRLL